MRRVWQSACWLALLLVTAAHSQPVADEPEILEVGLRVTAPFVMAAGEHDQAHYKGLAIELWEDVARQNGWKYRYRPMPLKDLFDELEAGTLDVALGALTVTEARELRVNFTQPFMADGLGIATRRDSSLSISALAIRLWEGGFVRWILGLIGLLFLVGVLAWLVERKANPAQFGGSPAEGIGSGFWWAAVTMSTVGYGDKAPATFAGRMLALVWMFTAIILVSVFTAGVTASLTVGALEGQINGPGDLHRVRVAAVANSTGYDWLESRHLRATTVERTDDALRLLAAGNTDAVVAGAAVLQYQVQQDYGADLLQVLPGRLDRQLYALALRQDRPELLEAANRAVLKVLETERWQRLLEQTLGEAP